MHFYLVDKRSGKDGLSKKKKLKESLQTSLSRNLDKDHQLVVY